MQIFIIGLMWPLPGYGKATTWQTEMDSSIRGLPKKQNERVREMKEENLARTEWLNIGLLEISKAFNEIIKVDRQTRFCLFENMI